MTAEVDREAVLDAVRSVWAKHPHMRLGQLLENVTYRPSTGTSRAVFYIHDDVLIALLQRYEDKSR